MHGHAVHTCCSGNWRITFDELDGAVARVNLEDYH